MPSELITLSEQKDGLYPFEVLLLSKEPIDTFWHGRFVIELASLQYHKPRLAVDFNHNDYIIIGYAENFRNTDEGLVAGGNLVTNAEGETGEFARNLVKWIESGVPMEASAVVELDEAVCETVPAGQSVEVDGKTHAGPISVFRNVPLTGLAACPHGADKFTRFTLLSMEKTFMAKNITKMNPPATKLAADATASDAPQDTPPEKTVKDPELAEFIEVFGTEKGLELWQSGADIAEVRQLKELLDKYGVPGNDSNDSNDHPPEPEPKKDDESEKLSARLKPLADSVTKLSGELAKIKSALPRGETKPLHHGLADSETKNISLTPNSSIDKLAAKYAGIDG